MQDPSADIEIIEDGIKKTFHEEIIEKIEKILVPKLTFFVGAGISHAPPSKLPLFKELNKEIIRSATSDMPDEDDYETLSDNIRPEIVLRILTDILPQELMYKLLWSLEKIMTKVEPNPNHLLLAQALKQGGWVFTTNYDNLIEKACRNINLDVEKRKCYRDEDFDEFKERYLDVRNIPGGYLFKLHGSIEDPKSILATLKRIGKGLAGSKNAILKYFFQNFNFCFMGYSCRDDFDILPTLLDTPSEKGICWFQHAGREIGEVIWGQDILQYEKEKEENKPLGEIKDWETINVNELLLKTESSFKVIGDSSKFVEQKLWRYIGRKSVECAISEGGNMRGQFAHWAKEISDHDKNLIAGLLFHYIESFDKAEGFFKKSEDSAQKEKEKAIAQRWQADTYYRKETYEDAIEILTQKTLPLCEELCDTFMVAQIKTDIANNLRRLKRFPEALKYAREAKELFENKKEEFIKGKSEEEYELEYARCLNILGLVYYGGRDPSNPLPAVEEASRFCEESRKIREHNGDISMAAESENAMGLILYEQAKYLSKFDKEKAIQLLKEKSLECFEKALDKKERVGDYRGCQQCYRNLGLVYDLLAELVPKEEKGKYQQPSLRVYEEEANYMRRTLNPPKERFLEVLYRLGMRHLELGTIDKSIGLLREVAGRRAQPKDWHDKARALNGLREAYEKTGQKEECKECCFTIKSIYQGVLTDNNKLKEMKDAKIKFENATKEILPNTKNSLERIGLTSEAKQVDDILKELKRKITADSE
jgi:tetratricopeptide (TPR) repeat protein